MFLGKKTALGGQGELERGKKGEEKRKGSEEVERLIGVRYYT